MNREEAQKLLGTQVSAWTAWRGTYVGELVEVVRSRPWRGVVKVALIEQLPYGEHARVLKEGELLEVGGVNIKPVEALTELTWLETGRRLLEAEVKLYENYLAARPGDAVTLRYMERRLANLRRQIS